MLVQVFSDFMKLGQVILQKLDRFLVLRFYKVDGQVSIWVCVSGEQEREESPPRYWFATVSIGNHIESIAHAVAGDHCTGELGCLLDIVGGTGCDGVEDDFLCCAGRRVSVAILFAISSLDIRKRSPSSTCMV